MSVVTPFAKPIKPTRQLVRVTDITSPFFT